MIGKKILRQIEIDAVFFIVFIAAVGVALAVGENYRPHFHSISSLPTSQKNLPLMLAPLHDPETVVWLSSDGQQELSMKTVYHRDNYKTYTFSTTDLATGSNHTIFSNTLDNGTIMRIPFNSWSPDDAYIFIDQVKAGKTTYMVANVSGEAFENKEHLLNVSALFDKQQTGNVLHEVTGWASPTLLIITTQTNNGNEGQSYWFDVPSQSFIPLATQF